MQPRFTCCRRGDGLDYRRAVLRVAQRRAERVSTSARILSRADPDQAETARVHPARYHLATGHHAAPPPPPPTPPPDSSRAADQQRQAARRSRDLAINSNYRRAINPTSRRCTFLGAVGGGGWGRRRAGSQPPGGSSAARRAFASFRHPPAGMSSEGRRRDRTVSSAIGARFSTWGSLRPRSELSTPVAAVLFAPAGLSRRRISCPVPFEFASANSLAPSTPARGLVSLLRAGEEKPIPTGVLATIQGRPCVAAAVAITAGGKTAANGSLMKFFYILDCSRRNILAQRCRCLRTIGRIVPGPGAFNARLLALEWASTRRASFDGRRSDCPTLSSSSTSSTPPRPPPRPTGAVPGTAQPLARGRRTRAAGASSAGPNPATAGSALSLREGPETLCPGRAIRQDTRGS